MTSQTPTTPTTVTDPDGRVWQQCACGAAWFRADGTRTMCGECRDRADQTEWVDVTDTYRHLFPTLTGRILIERGAFPEPVTMLEEAHFPEPPRDTLIYWGVPDLDSPLPLVTCAECGRIVCHCESVERDGGADPDAA